MLVIQGPEFVYSSGFTVKPYPLLDHLQQVVFRGGQSVEDHTGEFMSQALKLGTLTGPDCESGRAESIVLLSTLECRCCGVSFRFSFRTELLISPAV